MSERAPAPGADERDPVVTRALAELPVPEHRLTFWADLDAAVADAARAAPGAAADEGERPDAEIPVLRRSAAPRPRGRRTAPWLAVAAGLLVLAGAVGFVLTQDDDDGEVADDTSTLPEATSIAPDTTATTVATTSELPRTTVAATADPVDAARAFIEALGAGDTDAALALLGPRSVAAVESSGADPLGAVSELQEGYGAWAGAEDLELSAAPAGVVPPLTAELAIVTVQGTHPGEGEPAFRVDAFPLVREGEGWVVELLALPAVDDHRFRFTLPPMDASGALGGMQPTDEINVFVPVPGTVLFQVDGGEVHADETADIPAGTFSLHAPPEPLTLGTHTLVAVAVGADGTITPFGGTFTVEG